MISINSITLRRSSSGDKRSKLRNGSATISKIRFLGLKLDNESWKIICTLRL